MVAEPNDGWGSIICGNQTKVLWHKSGSDGSRWLRNERWLRNQKDDRRNKRHFRNDVSIQMAASKITHPQIISHWTLHDVREYAPKFARPWAHGVSDPPTATLSSFSLLEHTREAAPRTLLPKTVTLVTIAATRSTLGRPRADFCRFIYHIVRIDVCISFVCFVKVCGPNLDPCWLHFC